MNPTLLRTVLDERSADPPATITDHDGRTAGVRRKVAARRRRRLGAGTGAAALIAAVLGLAVPQVWGGGADPAPDGQRVDAAEPFPEYLDGYRVVATASAPLADRSVSITFVPTTPDFVLYTRCDDHGVDDPNLSVEAEVSVGNLGAEGVFCSLTSRAGDAAELVPWEAFGTDVGVEGGEPVTLTITLTTVAPQVTALDQLPPIPSRGTVTVAVAEPVPFQDYPLPPPPAELAPLPENPSGSFEVRANAADPNQRIETTMEWGAALAGCGGDDLAYPVNLVSQTPGTLRVLVEGVQVAEHTWWDYRQEGSIARLDSLCSDLSDGEEVTIVVEPEHMTGDWQVVIGPPGG